jgi:hypothetical protein
MVTAFSTVSASAPTYSLVTETWGGDRVGYIAIGRFGMHTAPLRMISKAQTVANTGRRMKKSTNKVSSLSFRLYLGANNHPRCSPGLPNH